MASILGLVARVWGICSVFGYFDLWFGKAHHLACIYAYYYRDLGFLIRVRVVLFEAFWT